MNYRPLIVLIVLVLIPLALARGQTTSADFELYRIGAGDTLSIEVFGESDLSPRVRVDQKGTISYPFLGELRVQGLTTDELAQAIHDGLEGPYLVDPKVSVSVSEYRPYYVNGQVKSPGGYPFQPGMTVRKAISVAGGLSERASTRKIYLLNESARSEDQRVRVEMDAPIGPGDIVTVEESFF